MAVVFDVAGTGATSATSGITAAGITNAHTLGASATAIVAAVGCGNTSTSTISSSSCLIGATAMTLLGRAFNNVVGNGWSEMWGLIAPPTGAQTITYKEACSGSTFPTIEINTFSYTGVGSFGTAVTNLNTVNSTAVTTGSVASAAGHVVVANLGMRSATLTPTGSGTSRYKMPAAGTGNYVTTNFQDIAGASTVTMTATGSINSTWEAVAVDLIPPPPTPTNLFFPFLTMAPLILLGAPSRRYSIPKTRKGIRHLLKQRAIVE